MKKYNIDLSINLNNKFNIKHNNKIYYVEDSNIKQFLNNHFFRHNFITKIKNKINLTNNKEIFYHFNNDHESFNYLRLILNSLL